MIKNRKIKTYWTWFWKIFWKIFKWNQKNYFWYRSFKNVFEKIVIDETEYEKFVTWKKTKKEKHRKNVTQIHHEGEKFKKSKWNLNVVCRQIYWHNKITKISFLFRNVIYDRFMCNLLMIIFICCLKTKHFF